MTHLKQIVALKEVKCFAYHGFYPEEQIIGNHFIVDLSTAFIPHNFEDNLADTVNYEHLNAIIHQAMKQTQKLLETVLHQIIKDVLALYPFVEKIEVTIRKLNPPMVGEIGASSVQLIYQA